MPKIGNGNGGSGNIVEAENTFGVNGFSLLNSPTVKGSPKGGNENGGTVTIEDGDVVFEEDDIIVIVATNVAADGSITEDSEIVSLIVYDNADDYLNGNILYTYVGASGQTAEISNSTASLGDTYLGFNANTLTSLDPNAPDLGQVFIAAGEDLTVVAAGGTLTIDTIAPNGDGNFDGGGGVICVARGTLIDAPGGPRPVESLAAGDLVHTLDDGPQPIRWIGSRLIDARGRHAPVRISAGALGNLRDLYVSPNHRMLLSGARSELLFGEAEVLVAAKHLLNDTTIRPAPRPTIEYFHFLFDRHQIVFAESCPTESLYPGEQTLDIVGRESRDEILNIFADLDFDETPLPLSRYELNRCEAVALKLSA